MSSPRIPELPLRLLTFLPPSLSPSGVEVWIRHTQDGCQVASYSGLGFSKELRLPG